MTHTYIVQYRLNQGRWREWLRVLYAPMASAIANRLMTSDTWARRATITHVRVLEEST